MIRLTCAQSPFILTSLSLSLTYPSPFSLPCVSQILCKLCHFAPGITAVLGSLDSLIDPLEKTVTKKANKEGVVGPEVRYGILLKTVVSMFCKQTVVECRNDCGCTFNVLYIRYYSSISIAMCSSVLLLSTLL